LAVAACYWPLLSVQTNHTSDFDTFTVDRFPVDTELTDAGHVGPELAHMASAYIQAPRALVWRNASSDWPLLVLLLPMGTRLSMMSNPIFANLVRDWGMNIRFIGVDFGRRVFDFRKLLTDDLLRKLVGALGQINPQQNSSSHQTLDLLFNALAQGMLTMLEQRRANWPDHLAREHRLEPSVMQSLFDRQTRFSDFYRALQAGLRSGAIDLEFYARALRSVDLREETLEQRLASLIKHSLDEDVLAKLAKASVGLHLGCYNWLAIDPTHASQRQYLLQRLSCFAQFFSDSLLKRLDLPQPLEHWPQSNNATVFARLSQAVDSGQDRLVIDALAQRFAVSSNTVRSLWRQSPKGLGTPPTWHLEKILLRLDAVPERAWPNTPQDWLAFGQSAAN
jgi:hypothetical protein